MVNQFSMEEINDIIWDSAEIDETDGNIVIEYGTWFYRNTLIAKDISALLGVRLYYHCRVPYRGDWAYIFDNGEEVLKRNCEPSECEWIQAETGCPGVSDDPEELEEWGYDCETCHREHPEATKRTIQENGKEVEHPPDVNMFDWVKDLLKEL